MEFMQNARLVAPRNTNFYTQQTAEGPARIRCGGSTTGSGTVARTWHVDTWRVVPSETVAWKYCCTSTTTIAAATATDACTDIFTILVVGGHSNVRPRQLTP